MKWDELRWGTYFCMGGFGWMVLSVLHDEPPPTEFIAGHPAYGFLHPPRVLLRFEHREEVRTCSLIRRPRSRSRSRGVFNPDESAQWPEHFLESLSRDAARRPRVTHEEVPRRRPVAIAGSRPPSRRHGVCRLPADMTSGIQDGRWMPRAIAIGGEGAGLGVGCDSTQVSVLCGILGKRSSYGVRALCLFWEQALDESGFQGKLNFEYQLVLDQNGSKIGSSHFISTTNALRVSSISQLTGGS